MRNELVLSSNNIGVNTTKESLLKKKKKGFTLVELIAVIAILAILAAIIVPRVASYTASANNAKYLADAKTIAQAAELYQTETGTTISDGTTLNDLKTTLMTVNTTTGHAYLTTFPPSTEFTNIAPADGTNAVSTYGSLKSFVNK